MLLPDYTSTARLENVEGKLNQYEQADASHENKGQAIPD
jgi:hypothetical protein